ncbi:MAG: VCBS repeat-containing protein, partial [Actinobacteria bacterium]|nr:VCBS repeat-containing protein [Actinomycetota bacterium]NIS34293.1 VCBS repeat-containing protein [Actinomycetota bacterium]NIT97376.1 VCBS repeat-containing protein [Actinomycetota bacterium]NIU21047.1 VCBS repeat-containing protein [Actinomycetota bacterium]NIU69077.1 VCBS repeat-containing protein [Actinomycetota bacterium]
TVAGVAFGISGEATGAMAGAVGDLDNDGLPDILVTDTSYGSLYRNTAEGLFEDWVVRSGLAAPSGQWVSWGGGFFDFDNDG